MNVSIQPPVIIVTANGISGNRAIEISSFINTAIAAESAAAASAQQAAASAAMLNLFVSATPFSFTTTGVTDYDLPVGMIDARYIQLHVGGVRQWSILGDFSVIVKGGSPTGYGLRIIDMSTGGAWPAGLTVVGMAQPPIAGAIYVDFATRDALLAWIGAGAVVADGVCVTAAGLRYMGQLGANLLPSLPGLVPVDPQPGHYGITGAVIVPTHFATLQAAVNAFGSNPSAAIEVRIAASHRPTTGLPLSNGDYSRYSITAETRTSAAIILTGTVAVSVGEVLTQATSGATGKVLSQGGLGSKLILLETVSGTFNTANQLTGSVSGALGVSSVPVYAKANVVELPTFTGSFISGEAVNLPTLGCLIAGSGKTAGLQHGYLVQNGSGVVLPNCGSIGAWQNGIYVKGGSLFADYSIAVANAQNNTTSANIMGWAAQVSAEFSDMRFSGYYGGQGAHGGIVSYKSCDATGAFRYGFRGSDAAIVNVDGATANNCGVYGFYSFNGSVMSGDTVTALNCGTYGATAVSSGILNLGAADLSGGTAGIYVSEAATASVYDGNAAGDKVRGAIVGGGGRLNAGNSNLRRTDGADAANDIVVSGGGTITRDAGTLGGNSQCPNELLKSGQIIDDSLAAFGSPTLNTNVNDWNPSPNSKIIRPAPTATRIVTGFVARLEGSQVTLINNGTGIMRLSHESASSAAANRFTLSHAQSLNVFPGQDVVLTYLNGRWAQTGGTAQNIFVCTVATVPAVNLGMPQILVTDEVGGAVMAFCDGTNWRRVTDRAIVA